MTKHDQLGKYRILDELGKGGFATVYRAVDTTLDREVALKVLDPLLMRDEKWVQHFRQEAKTVAALEHPHIVGIYEINEVEGRLYIAMKLASGNSLAYMLATRGRLPWSETLALLQPVCQALDYAHGQGVVHRDLKPANVLLDPDGPLLTDFGFARLLVDNSMSLSLSGGILGTPSYIAPEIWEYDRAEVPADIYALGCITYEMLLGEPLFDGKTPMQVMRAHDKGPQFAETWPEDVPKGLSTVLCKALAREPETRYPAANSFWYALNDLEAQAEAGREAAERAAVAAQWRAEAEAAMAEGEWSAAKMAVGRWLVVTPEDAEAQALQEEIERHIANAQSPSRPDPLAAFYDRLQALIEREHWDEARQQAKEILARDPEYRDVQDLAPRITEKLVAQYRTEAKHAMAAEDWPKAKKAVKRWLNIAPDDAEARALQDRLSRPTTEKSQVPKPVTTSGSRQGSAWIWGGGLIVLFVIAILVVDAENFSPALTSIPLATMTETPTATALSTSTLRLSPTVVPKSSNPPTLTVTATPSPSPSATPTPPLPTATPTLNPGAKRVRQMDGMIQVYVPAGKFQMGNTETYTVILDAFWLDQTEVTNTQYEQCVVAGVCNQSAYANDNNYNGAEKPVIGVSWFDAVDYCKWVGGRLPTDAEWEYAARGPERLMYPWGNTWQANLANCNEDVCRDGYSLTAPVGSFPGGSSWVGALDMSGNAWEWVKDWYGELPSGEQVNPVGPMSGDIRIVRGGSWYHIERYLRSTYRMAYAPSFNLEMHGFRCVEE